MDLKNLARRNAATFLPMALPTCATAFSTPKP
jgi:hypothetical protein